MSELLDKFDEFMASMPDNICLLCSKAIPVGDELCPYCDSGVRAAIEADEGPDWESNERVFGGEQ